MESILKDIQFGVRSLLKRPGFTLIVVLTLGLGIGANTAIFSVVNAVFLKPLPYPNPEQLVTIWGKLPAHGLNQLDASAAEFVDYRDRNHSFSAIATYATLGRNLTGAGNPERVNATFVTHGFFDVLGVQPIYGRSFLGEEDQPGHNQVVILSNALWKRHFASDKNPVGEHIVLDGVAHTVVGVMPANFEFPNSESQLWKPMAFDADDLSENDRGSHYLSVIARTKPDVSIEQANSDLATIAAAMQKEHPSFYEEGSGWAVNAVSLQEEIVGESRAPLLVSLAVVGFVLLIACANVANLLLGRAASRRREVAIRSALGAGRWQLIRQLLLESLLLSLAGAIVGILLAAWGRDLLSTLMPIGLQGAGKIPLDSTVILFTLALSLLTGLLFGLAPALQASKLDLTQALKESATNTSEGKNRHSLRRLLVVSEMALAMLLLIGAGLMIKSLYKLQQVELGFDPKNVLTMRLSLPRASYPKPETQRSVFDGIIDRVTQLPGVKSVGVVNFLPLSGNNNRRNISVEGAPENLTNVEFRLCNSDYFKVMGIAPISGRLFDDRDRENTPYVAVVNESFVKIFLNDQSPLGQRIKMGGLDSPFKWLSVVGVINDIKHKGPAGESAPEMYVSYLQPPLPQWNVESMFIALRTEVEPISAIASVTKVVREVDKELPIYSVQTMEQLLSRAVAPRRFNMQLISSFSGLALILASVGIYGVMSYSVTQRTRELGIRMALGAKTFNVLSLILREGLALALIGVGIGVAAALGLTQLMTKLLFGIEPTDVTTFTAAALLLVGVAFFACYLPARRATKVDPLVALRYE